MNRLLDWLVLPRVRPDAALLISLALIGCIGLVMVGSASVAVADRMTGDPMYFFYRQAIYALIGLVVAFLVLHVPLRVWEANTFTLLGGGLLLLVVVLVPGIGHAVNGAQRWIDFGPISMQASEPARLALILYVAGYAARRRLELTTSWSGLFKPMLFMVIASFLLLLEPDYGAAAILVAVAGLILFLAGARLLHLVVLAGAAGGLLVALALSSPYRVARLVSFADPWAHPYASGFQLTQSLIAIGRGEIAGVGLGNSVQKLMYLPETHTDFLFAIYAEEFGLIGSLLLIGLFGLVVWRGFAIGRRALDMDRLFAGFAAYGLSSWLALQAFVNIAVNMGILPTKGLTLPLMSYGGSSLVIMCVLCALLIRVDIETRQPESGQSKSRRAG
ncbi:cell division protein FtsW [Salinisphaera orenii MK-B5]|uniref:Probable peptidoglycan glycosyltransferase FtsW n=1 Tax=Salinisphaera orenii MK-B5 TaxID=856730 RepID=A0A423PHJ7_9GAMM|nr:putative lipid II flippase FtsW [Salinisphaera orenii]ROO25067.1 cell division protein FtsW [Salinisphaera orenii MK-B5]